MIRPGVFLLADVGNRIKFNKLQACMIKINNILISSILKILKVVIS